MPESYDFNDIRPYRDHEVPEVLQRLAQNPEFLKLTKYLFPETEAGDLQGRLFHIHTIKDFQMQVMYPAAKRVLEQSADEVTHAGFDKLVKGQSYLFISNHRDIVLDSAILNVLLTETGHDTTEVAIGNNLLISQMVTDLVKLNKNFIVQRNVPPREMYTYSQKLSAYIRETLVERSTSVWIAQREGRTKDGDDRTQQGLLKMLGLSDGDDFYENYRQLHLAPMAISYEFDPCDILKAQELQAKAAGKPLEKTPEDDLKSMVKGITGIKGRVHLALGKIVDEKLRDIQKIKNKNEQMHALATLIDERIHRNYKLWPSNLIAYDRLNEPKFQDQYDQKEEQRFDAYLEQQMSGFVGDHKALQQVLLEMYANPVKNREEVEEKVS